MRTLVLNAGYEPLGVISFRRALVLVLNQKAVVLAASPGDPVRAVNREFAQPSVILLQRYVRTPRRREIPISRRGVLRRDGYRCAYCGKSANTVDHVLPKSRGGETSWQNLVAACLKCNNKKSNQTLAEIGWQLGFTPKMPFGPAWSIRGVEATAPEWQDYLRAA